MADNQKLGDLYAGISDEDRELLEQYGQIWKSAYSAGNQSEMNAAHTAAEAVRAKYGYSGGADGAKYNQLDQGDNGYRQFDDFYSGNGYGQVGSALKNELDAYTQQTVDGYGALKRTVNNDADKLAREAYISYMQAKNSLPQQLTAAGYTGGMADSFKVGLDSTLQNNQKDIAVNRANAIYELDQSIRQAISAGNMETARQQAQLMQSAISDWNSYTAAQEDRKFNSQMNSYNIGNQNIQNALKRDLEREDLTYNRQLEAAATAYQRQMAEYERRYKEAVTAASYGNYKLLEALLNVKLNP